MQSTPNEDLAVSLSTVKQHLGIIGDYDDDRLTLLIRAAQEWFEDETGLKLTQQEWTWTMRSWPCGPLKLPFAPVSDLSIMYYNTDNTEVEWEDFYAEYSDTRPTKVMPAVNESYPSVYERHDAITIMATFGYETLPPAITAAICEKVASMNENREGDVKHANIDRFILNKRIPWLG